MALWGGLLLVSGLLLGLVYLLWVGELLNLGGVKVGLVEMLFGFVVVSSCFVGCCVDLVVVCYYVNLCRPHV